ncbi:hypothetical protein ACFXKF_38045 [Streptomyces scopuliridis]|uniref:hypothetical protein n=1 Tax=Streptomyces scopuliridis TaxID=452529 RepID=UPI003680EF7F
MVPTRSAGPAGGRIPVAVVTVAAVVCGTVKLMRSMSRPGRVRAVSAAARIRAW